MRLRAAVILSVLVALAAGPMLGGTTPVGAATVPAGFSDVAVATVAGPTALAFTPDGRMLVATKAGRLYVRRNGVLGTTPALDLSSVVCTQSERGLLGVAVDPAFATNRFVYVYYTHVNGSAACPTASAAWPANRVSRFVLADDDTVSPATEVVLFDGIPSVNGNHNGGDVAFGPDGKLYVSIGDSGCDYVALTSCGGNNNASRDTHVALGKILRISPVDGSAPADNPFAGAQPPCRDDGFTTAGNHCPETFAWGFRNPFRMAFAADGRLYVNDVGQNAWEEIDDVQAGRDYGWNLREGKCTTGSTTSCPAPPAGLTDPIFSYGRSDGCTSITGAAFAPASWPEPYRGDYLFADYACGKIFRLEGTTRVDLVTALGASSAVHLQVGPDGALYYTTFAGGGEVRRIVPPSSTPTSTTLVPPTTVVTTPPTTTPPTTTPPTTTPTPPTTTPTPPTTTVPVVRYLSGLTPVSATNGYGPYERDTSVGGPAAGDGRTIRLNGVAATKGLGVHANSAIVYTVPAGVTSLRADIGVDDECGAGGSVGFLVLVNGARKYSSGVMRATTATRSPVVAVKPGNRVTLKVTNGGDGFACDHADWANARFQ